MGLFAIYGPRPISFGHLDPNKGTTSEIVSLGQFLVPSTESRVLIFEPKNNKFYAALYDSTSIPYLVSILPTGQITSVQINSSCIIWQFFYDDLNSIFYGMTLESNTEVTLYTISLSGVANLIGSFPLAADAKPKLIKESQTCFVLAQAGAIIDSESQLLYYYYSTGSGMYVELVNLKTAKVITHFNLDHDLVSPILGPDYIHIYSLEMDPYPPYSKNFAVANINTGIVQSFPTVNFFGFWSNEATLKINNDGSGIYFTPMTRNATDNTRLVGMDIQTGKVISDPVVSPIIWNILYIN